MPILRFALLLLTISVTTQSMAQLTSKRKTELDEYARKTPAVHARSTRSLVDYLVKPAQNDLEKVRLIFTWVALHIQYNDAAFNSGNIPDQSAEAIMKSKSAVCEGFSNLFEDLLQEAGFETKHITGY